MKAILVIDVPDGIDLDRYRANGLVRQVIFDLEEVKRMYSTPIAFNFCSLKPMPEKKNTDFHPNIVYANGWNDCLKEITE